MKLSTIVNYLWTTILDTPYSRVKLSPGLTARLRLALLARAQRIARTAGLSVVALLLLMPMAYASECNNVNIYQSYAQSLVTNKSQMKCLTRLYYEESRWNYKAVNNGHYGIPQGKSKWLKNANPYEQIEWGVAYNLARYGSMCGAYKHWRKYGWH